MKDLRRILQRGGIGIGALLLLYQIIQGISAVQSNRLPTASPLLLLLAFGLIAFSFIQQMISWEILMRGLGASIAWKPLFQGYILSFLPRYIPGTVWGYLSRSEWLFRDHQISYTLSSVGSLLEIVVALVSNGVIGGIYLYTRGDTTARIEIIFALCALVIVPWVIFQVSRRPWATRFFFKGSYPGMKLELPLLTWETSVLLITLNMLLYGLALYLTYQGLNFPTIRFSPANFFAFASIFSAAWVSGFVVFFLPSGLGVREITLSALLTLNFGLPLEQASLMSVLFRLIVTLAELLWLGIGVCLRMSRPSEQKGQRENC